jgi:PadR family transcriptional regulator PadR
LRGDVVKGHLELLLLAVLEQGPGHGYALIDRLRARSDGAFDLPEGTIYPALYRLESAGLLASGWAEAGGRRRRVYRLTPRGRAALVERGEEWRRFRGAVDVVVGGS